MPQLDGVSIIAFASFFGLIVAWLAAPPAAPATVKTEPLPAAA